MKVNAIQLLKLCVWIVAILLILSSDGESGKTRKRDRKSKKRVKGQKKKDKQLKNLRQQQRRSHDLDFVNPGFLSIQQNMKDSALRMKYRERSLPLHPNLVRPVQFDVNEWREASIEIHSTYDNETVLYEAVAAISHHSTADNVNGQLIHVLDADMQGHFGCSNIIGNKKDLPRDQPWVALVKRGKCRFFNKIRLARLHNAKAIIIYNHDDKREIMNSAGTEIMSMMISSSDGEKLINLFKFNDGIEVRISVINGTRTNLDVENVYPTTVTTAFHKPTSGATHNKEFILSVFFSLVLTFFSTHIAINTNL